jgi:hypothetical protein
MKKYLLQPFALAFIIGQPCLVASASRLDLGEAQVGGMEKCKGKVDLGLFGRCSR